MQISVAESGNMLYIVIAVCGEVKKCLRQAWWRARLNCRPSSHLSSPLHLCLHLSDFTSSTCITLPRISILVSVEVITTVTARSREHARPRSSCHLQARASASLDISVLMAIEIVTTVRAYLLMPHQRQSSSRAQVSQGHRPDQQMRSVRLRLRISIREDPQSRRIPLP